MQDRKVIIGDLQHSPTLGQFMAVSKKSESELEDQRRLGHRIRSIRDRLQLTRNQVADTLGTNELMVQRLENGAAILTVPRLLKLAEAFRLDPAELIRSLSDWEAQEPAPPPFELTSEEHRLLRAFHRIQDKVQRRNLLELMERMSP